MNIKKVISYLNAAFEVSAIILILGFGLYIRATGKFNGPSFTFMALGLLTARSVAKSWIENNLKLDLWLYIGILLSMAMFGLAIADLIVEPEAHTFSLLNILFIYAYLAQGSLKK